MKKAVIIFNVILLTFVMSISVMAHEKGRKKHSQNTDAAQNINYKEKMMEFVEGISSYSKQKKPGFIIAANNTEDILTDDEKLNQAYINSIDAAGKEDIFYGADGDDVLTDLDTRNATISKLTRFKQNNKPVLSIDYCSGDNIEKCYQYNKNYGYVPFAAQSRDLDMIGDSICDENSNDILSINDAKNFLYIINMGKYKNKRQFIEDIQDTNYDCIVIDAFFNSKNNIFTEDEIESLKVKKNGGKRLVLSYMSIGEAESYRYYYEKNAPYIVCENENWEGNFVVNYWDKDWQQIIYGNDDSYTAKILDAGFDGVFLDVVDAYYYFE